MRYVQIGALAFDEFEGRGRNQKSARFYGQLAYANSGLRLTKTDPRVAVGSFPNLYFAARFNQRSRCAGDGLVYTVGPLGAPR